ncbi:MAG TPA: DinB family protein [Methylomirabilota bacterium]|nr:DinB family protein [Methylomirabilota bacterium]
MATDRSYVDENRAQRARLEALVNRLDDRELSRPLEAGWTVAAVLAHLAFWDYRIVTLLDAWGADGRGTPPPAYDQAAVDWINDAGKPLCLALPPRAAARLAVEAAGAADERVAGLSDAVLAANVAAGSPISVHRAEHRREHLDEIERGLAAR